MKTILPDHRLGDIVTAHPEASRLFDHIGLDFCCSGHLTLTEACEAKGYDPDEVLALLNVEEPGSDADAPRLDSLSLTDLVDHIESTHHAYLWRELERLSRLTTKVAQVHGGQDPRLVELHALFSRFAEEMSLHMRKEEEILFPMLRKLEAHAKSPFTSQGDSAYPAEPPQTRAVHCGSVGNPIRQMRHEHDNAGETLTQMRALAGNFAVPGHACTTYRAMLEGLEQLEGDMHAHVHKENHILFPRALSLSEVPSFR